MPATPTSRINGITTSVAVKAPCQVATSAPITLSGLQTISGLALTTEDRVLVKDQVDTTENGIYYPSTGTWTRAPDFDGNLDAVDGTRILVGTDVVYATVCADGPVTFGTSNITFVLAGVGDGSGTGIIHYVATVGGTANAITLTATVNPGAYASGLTYSFIAALNNTGSTTVNVSGVGVAPILTKQGAAMIGGEITPGTLVFIEYSAATSSFYMIDSARSQFPLVTTVGGSANAITLTPTVAITSYTNGLTYSFVATANNSAATTINVSGVGAVALLQKEGDAMTGGEIAINGVIMVQYRTSNNSFYMVNSGRNLTGAYTPVWSSTSGTAPAIGNGTITGFFAVTGHICFVNIQLLFGSSSTFGSAGTWNFSLPLNFSGITSTFIQGGAFYKLAAGGLINPTPGNNTVWAQITSAAPNVVVLQDNNGSIRLATGAWGNGGAIHINVTYPIS